MTLKELEEAAASSKEVVVLPQSQCDREITHGRSWRHSHMGATERHIEHLLYHRQAMVEKPESET